MHEWNLVFGHKTYKLQLNDINFVFTRSTELQYASRGRLLIVKVHIVNDKYDSSGNIAAPYVFMC